MSMEFDGALSTQSLRALLDSGGIVLATARPDPIATGRQAGEIQSWLDAQERAQHGGFHFARDQRLYLAAHGLLRALLGACSDRPPASLQFRKDAWGRPFLHGPGQPGELHFSLSHTQGLVACAVSRWTEIGVDVEHVERAGMGPRSLSSVFAEEECRRIESAPLGRAAPMSFAHWTLKEAYAKARGLGLHLSFKDFAFHETTVRHPRIRFLRDGADDPARWHFELEPVSGAHLLALASGRRPGQPGILRCNWEVHLPSQALQFHPLANEPIS